MSVMTHPGRAIASAGGRLLAGATALLADARSTEKPLSWARVGAPGGRWAS